ncbi:hypothetical protein D3C75_1276550 [compost metagenome]
MQMPQYVILAVPQITGGVLGMEILMREDTRRNRNRHNLRGRGTLRTRDGTKD